MTTEQLVRRCFCRICKDRPKTLRIKGGLLFCKMYCPLEGHFLQIARASRRFARMEEKAKATREWELWKKHIGEQKGKQPELPPHFGEF